MAFIEQANKALDNMQPELAIKFLLRALEADPNSVLALETIGFSYMNIGNVEHAKTAFIRAIELEPVGFEKYLCLGQLTTSLEAIAYYSQGLQYLSQLTVGLDPRSEQALLLARKWSSALCSMTELYMTDLCDEVDAEAKCEAYMSQAIAMDSSNPEVYQTFASVRISQCKTQEASELLTQGLALWYTSDDDNVVLDPSWPPYASRLSLARLFIETTGYDDALKVIETCQLEDDEDPEVWYLYGLTYSLVFQSTSESDEKQVALESCQESFESLVQLCERLGLQADEQVKEMMDHAHQIITHLN